jgi:TP901 family phage tail tape measure protein
MADNIITTNITANADFSSLRAQLAAVTAQLVRLQETTAGTNAKLANQIAVMNKSFATTLTSTGQFSQHFVSLSSDVDKFGKNLDRGRLKLNEYYRVWNGHTKRTSTLVRDLAKQQVMLQQAVVQPVGKNAQGLMQYNIMVAKGLDEVKNKMAIATQQAAIMNKVMLDGSTALINWGKNTQWAGRQLTVGLTVPLVAFGAAAQKAFREADAELVRLTKVYGGLAATSSADLAQVRKDVTATAREIASSYGVAYKETIALAADLAATGQQGNDLISATQQTTRLSVLGEVDRQEAMKATLAIQNAFKQNTDELTQSIDFLNAVENQTSTSLQDLTEAIPKAGPVIKSLGGDVKDLALYLTAMKEGGVNAAEGANAIKSAMASLINPTKVAVEKFEGFGIDLKGIVNNNAGDLTATILDLQAALDNLNPLDKSRAIEQLFGKFQFARMSALFENLGKSGSQTLQVMDLMKASAVDLAAISERELKMMTESASGQFKRAWASVQADLAAAGEQFLRISTKVLQVVDGIIKFFQKLPEPVKTFLNVLGGITAISGPLIMMTGVLGNFVGYIIKGIFHVRQLVKGGQGFKLLTPEIIAADAAAKGLATSFYSDTEATIVLSNAVNTLAESFMNLEAKANAAKVSVQPAISTVAGGVVMAAGGGGRVVDKDSPLVGRPYSRDMSHLIPSGTPQMGTIFGTVPGSKPVNIRVGRNPQAYMDGDLPKIPGLTSIGSTSTGIVAAEAAKWHAMTAAISMQSQEELAILKKEVMATGTVTSSLSDSYQALLPEFTQITQLAAAETAAIVQQVQQGKLTVEAARAKIISLNATVEAMLAETTRLTAAGMGRTAALTTVPLTSQPVVDPTTGKANMKEMFHKGPTKEMVDRIARALGGVRTSGAGYNIETTKPRFAKGGFVPGTGNTDTYHTTAEAGSFVINKQSTQENLPLITNILGSKSYYAQKGGQVPVVLTPGEAVIPADIAQRNMPLMYELNGGPGNTSGSGMHFGGGSIGSIIRAVTQRGRQYRAKALLDDAGIPVAKLQNSVYPFMHRLNLRTRGGGKASAREFAETFESPDAFKLANAVLTKNGLKPISQEQHEAINAYLKNAKNMDPEEMLTEAGFGTHLTRAYQSAGVSKDQLLALAGKHTMRFSFPGSGSIAERRDELIKRLQAKYPEGSFSIDPRTDNNIVVKLPGEKPFKIEHEATRSIHGATGGVSYETLRQAIPAGATPEGKMAYGHLPIDETLLNAGGMVPGRMAQRLFPGGTVFLGMPRSLKQVAQQRAMRDAMEKASLAVKESRFAKKPVEEYGDLLEPTSGRSFPVPGIGGLYSKGSEKVFVKPVLDEKAALAEMRATEIARDVHGLHAPKQNVVVMRDPTDPSGRRRLLALESKYDPSLASQDPNFTTDQYFRQLVASALRADKDLARGNLSGNILSDVGPAGVFSAASGLRDYSAVLPSMRDQAVINLLGKKGSGAKKFFAESTHSIPKGMTADQYHDRMIAEIESALPKLKQTIGRFDLNSEEKVVYQAMIKRLSDAKTANWRELHGIHSGLTPSPETKMTPAALAKMIAADELKRRQMGHSVSLSDNSFKTQGNGFMAGGMIGNILKSKAMHRIGAGFGKDSTGGWGVTSLEIGMAEKLFASTGLTKRTQRILYDKFAAALAKEMPYGYTKNAQGQLLKALEPDIMDSVIRSAASSTISDPAGRKVLSAIDREILKKKFTNWESRKDTPLTETLKRLIFGLEGREKGGPVNSGQPYIVGEKGPEIFVPRNAGGIIPNSAPIAQGYNAGGFIKMMLMQLLGGYGGQALGKASGIPGADMVGMMVGSILAGGVGGGARNKNIGDGFEAPVKAQSALTRPMFSAARGTDGKILSNYGAGLEKLSASKNVFAKTAVFAAKSLTRLNLVIGAGAAAIYLAKNRFDAHKESMRLNALGYGMTAEAAQKAGLKFTSFNDQIKAGVENAKALRERNILLYESMKGSSTPLNITIEEYKKLKKEVKDNYSDQVLLINKTSTDDQEALAVRLKTQLMSMGLSAEEATKKIYAMYAASKFAFAASKYTVGNDVFKGIEDSSDAAVKAIEALSVAMKSGLDPKEQFNQLNTTMMAISSSIEERQAKAIKQSKTEYKKDNRYFGAAEEAKIKIDQEAAAMVELNKTIASQAVLTKEVVDEMAAIDPSIRQIINGQDTSLSLWQKTRLQVNGFTGDLKGLTAAQADALYSLQIETRKIVQSTASAPGGILSKQYTDLNKLKEAQAAYEKASKGQRVEQQISDRKRIAALQKQIDLNNKLADSRIKALDSAKQENDIVNEIAKKQAEYDAAIATGNNVAAQQASLDIKTLRGTLQYNAQKKSIEDATTLANEPLLRQIELIQTKQQGVADAAAIAGQKLGDVSKSIGIMETGIENVITAMTNYRTQMARVPENILDDWKKTGVGAGLIAAVTDAAKAANVSVPGMTKDKKGNYGLDDGTLFVDEWEKALKGLTTSTFDISGNVTVNINGKTLNTGAPGTGTFKDPKKGGLVSDALGDNLMGLPKRESITKGTWSNSVGPTSDRELVKNYAKEMGYTQGVQFILVNKDGSSTQFKVSDNKGNVMMVKEIPAPIKKHDGGPISGPGTGTSDSIPAYLSNGEYVIKEKAVRKYGVDTFDALNAEKFHRGGAVGHRHGRNAPDTRSRFERYADSNTASGDAAQAILDKSPLTSWMSADPLGVRSIIRKIAGKGRKGDTLNSILFPLNFLGLGSARSALSKPAAGIASKAAEALPTTSKVAPIAPALDRAVKLIPEGIANAARSSAWKVLAATKSVPLQMAAHKVISRPYSTSGFKNAYDVAQRGRSYFDDVINRSAPTRQTGAPVAARHDAWGDPSPHRASEAFGELAGLLSKTIKDKLIGAVKNSKTAKFVNKFKTMSSETLAKLKQFLTKDGLKNFIDYHTPIGGIKALQQAKAAGLVKSKAPDEGGLTLPIPQLLKNPFYHGGVLPESPVNRFAPGVPNDSQNIFGFDLFGTISPRTAQSYAISKNAENKDTAASLYEMLFSFAKAKVWDLRGGQPSLFSQNKQAYILLEKALTKKFAAQRTAEMAHESEKMAPDEIMSWAEKTAKALLLGERVPGIARVTPVDPQAPFSGEAAERSQKFWSHDLASIFTTIKGGVPQRLVDTIIHHGGTNFGKGGGGHTVIATMKPEEILTKFAEAVPGPVIQSTRLLSSDTFVLDQVLSAMLDQFAKTGIARPLLAAGHVLTNKAKPEILGANGGYISGGKFTIPKFETGINSVPADMLAMLHKNEAVVPANMNPFNPNANNATMGGAVYNITNNINGYDGNLEQLSSMVTQKTITAIKSLDSRNSKMVGGSMNVGIH